MYKKVIGILIVTLLITTAITTVGELNNTNSNLDCFNPKVDIMTDDEIDQENIENLSTGGGAIIWYQYLAQSFRPTKPFLTRVEISICNNFEHPGTLLISINESLTGDSLVSDSVHSSDLPDIWYPDFFWYEFDFPDLEVIPGMEYFIVCMTQDGDYEWIGNYGDRYKRGSCWFTDDNKTWNIHEEEDLGFRTYGYGNKAPINLVISGPSSGKVGTNYDYIFHASDPENDAIYYYIDWGDNSKELCIGPCESGYGVTVSYTWNEQDIYTIRAKAKDIYGAESDWAKLTVSMPKNKPYINTPFLHLLENHPYMFPLLQQLLKL